MKLNYNWKLADGYPPLTRGKVFSCFACGGGSTMGYKLAGFDVIGCNEIDPRMMEAYKANHGPKFSYLEDIRIFKNRTDLPEELYALDILDGSPPCSSFSVAGAREDGWGVEKKFREGQTSQILDTLFFDFVDLAKKLQPKVVVAENVKGLLMGEAREYYKKISFAFEDAGYEIQDFLLNAADMGVPQKRERVFYIGIRKDLAEPFMEQANLFYRKPKINLEFNETRIKFKDIMDTNASERVKINESIIPAYEYCMAEKTSDFAKYYEETTGKRKYFNTILIFLESVVSTIKGDCTHVIEGTMAYMNDTEIKRAGSFPGDYNFLNNKVDYLVGMSVPPLMMARIANEIWEQWLSKINTPCTPKTNLL